MDSYINFKCLLCIHKYVAYSNIPNFLNYPYGLLHTFEHKSFFFFINLNFTFIFFLFLLKHMFYTLIYTSYSLRIRHISYICVRCYNIIAGYGLTIEFYASITSFIHQLQLSFIHSCFIITTCTAGRKLCPLLLFTYIITFFCTCLFLWTARHTGFPDASGICFVYASAFHLGLKSRVRFFLSI